MSWESTYEKLELIGEGTYGEVLACRDRKTGQAVAVKILKMVCLAGAVLNFSLSLKEDEREGFPATSVREIKIQRQLSHPSLVNLIDCRLCPRQGDVSMPTHL